MSNRKKRPLNPLDHYHYVETKIATEVTRRTLVLILAGGEGSRLGVRPWGTALDHDRTQSRQHGTGQPAFSGGAESAALDGVAFGN